MSDTNEREEFNFGEDSEGLWYVAVGNEQIVWDLSPEQAEKVCAQLKSATSASDAKYQARVRELEEALQALLTTVENMKVPQTIADVGLQLMQFEPVLSQAHKALSLLPMV